MQPVPSRIHYLDNLRAWAMLLGVYLHGAFAYAQNSQAVWLATDPYASVTVDASIWFIHLFRMSLFFWLSGYFGKLVYERKGTASFVRERCIRLAVPFVLLYPILLGAMGVVIVFALSYLKSPSGLMGLIASAIKDNQPDDQEQPWSTMHLWFIYYLLFFSLLAPWVSRWRFLNFDWFFQRRYWAFLFPLALIPGAAMAGSPLPAPESFVPQLWPFAFYGLFFALGWQTRGREEYLRSLQAYIWPFTLVSAALFALYYALMPELNLDVIVKGTTNTSWQRSSVMNVLTAFLSPSLTLLALLWGQRYLDWHSPRMRLLADSSYWIYLIHLPMVLFLQTLLVPLDWPVAFKLLAVLLATMLFSMASYLVFVRYTPLGWILHGKRAFP